MALIFAKWSRLLTCVILTAIIFGIYRQTDLMEGVLKRDVTDPSIRHNCTRLLQKFSVIPSKRIDIKSFTKELTELLKCPVGHNVTQQEIHRVGLHFCCNATGAFFLTKKNTGLNKKILYEASNRHTHTVDPVLYNMLPEDLPWNKGMLGRCAVVGSGGILKNSGCGSDIDNTDFVIRFNMAPLNDSDEGLKNDVGLKTDLVTINPSQIKNKYNNIDRDPSLFAEHVSVYDHALLILPAFYSFLGTTLSIKVLKAMLLFRAEQRVVFFNPSYLGTLHNYWRQNGLKETRMSTGFMLVSMALEVCEEVHLYGFWPFAVDLNQRPISNHYYDNVGPNKKMHNMPQEFMHLLKLHSEETLTLHLQSCM